MATKCKKAANFNDLTSPALRLHISMNPLTQKRAQVLSRVERRSVSNLLAVLVDKEFDRLGLTIEETPKNGKSK